MKTILLSTCVLVSTFSAAAQDAMPTKEETVNYINKKLSEVEGRTERVNSGLTRKLAYLSFKLEGDMAVFSFSRVAGLDGLKTNTFNPAYIDRVSTTLSPSPDSTIGWILVYFPKKLVKQTCKSACDETTDHIMFPYLAATPEAKEKIKKAFLHLRDLAKAEDELF
jgi:hypothetical protein